MTDQITTDPTKPSQRMRAGSMTLTFGPWIVAAVLLAVLPFIFTNNSSITIMNQMWITVIFALAYNMLLGQGGMLSFGHAVYAGVGGFACMHIMNASDFFAALPLPVLPVFGGLFGMGLAIIVGSFSTRSAGTVFAMISLGVGELIAACSVIIVAFFGGEEGVSGDRTYAMPFFGTEFLQQIEVYYLISGWVLISAALMYLWSRTPVGRMSNAVRDNPERAEFLGYSARWVRFYSFVASGFFAGVAGGLFAINYEILTEENLNTTSSGIILLVTFLGGVGFFFGPIIGAIAFTLLQTVLSLQTELWAFYAGTLFVATVMFFPGGLAGLMMMHVPVFRLGKARVLIRPYLKTLLPALIGILGLSALVEMVFHVRHAAYGDDEMTLFWTTFNSHDILPWVIAIGVTAVALGITRATAPALREAWNDANTAGGSA
ncbi:ABC transporter permease [Sulfitobacter sp. EhC04]|uniref:branched-chain amino acid ABC transporter permease n=1 Tax=Sulfitobacter sp. EhC04 TaxID=1849168 RepID=UPI0007F3F59D|nr:branched-chain amino acid ABC transporter permease [Sulfitobacter sp. EhC04]OAN77894.1 ABC transporter permease [Sulfitobacter sp. EhC04]